MPWWKWVLFDVATFAIYFTIILQCNESHPRLGRFLMGKRDFAGMCVRWAIIRDLYGEKELRKVRVRGAIYGTVVAAVIWTGVMMLLLAYAPNWMD